MSSLNELIAEAQESGVASTVGGIDRLIGQASLSGMAFVPNRSAGPKIDVLKPTKAEESNLRSLSAVYGRGRQPLHTDGAHQLNPPDILLLASEPSSVPTRYWRFSLPGLRGTTLVEDVVHGVFTVRSGRLTFLTPILDSGVVRYDPVCMTPADSRANRAAEWLESLDEQAAEFEWTTPGLVLAIDNRRVLHARDDASQEPNRIVRRAALRVQGIAS